MAWALTSQNGLALAEEQDRSQKLVAKLKKRNNSTATLKLCFRICLPSILEQFIWLKCNILLFFPNAVCHPFNLKIPM